LVGLGIWLGSGLYTGHSGTEVECWIFGQNADLDIVFHTVLVTANY